MQNQKKNGIMKTKLMVEFYFNKKIFENKNSIYFKINFLNFIIFYTV